MSIKPVSGNILFTSSSSKRISDVPVQLEQAEILRPNANQILVKSHLFNNRVSSTPDKSLILYKLYVAIVFYSRRVYSVKRENRHDP